MTIGAKHCEITKATHEKLRAYCERTGRRMGWVADEAIREWLERTIKVETLGMKAVAEQTSQQAKAVA